MDFKYRDTRNQRVMIFKGQLVDVKNKHEAARMLAAGKIAPREDSYLKSIRYGEAAPQWKQTKRIGIWLKTSTQYSGGRIHLWQYAHNLAELGAEVWLITDNIPKWRKDYPTQENLTIAYMGEDAIPPDLDLIVTDSKMALGMKAFQFKEQHPHIPFVCFNFETPNWVGEYDAEYAEKLQSNKHVFGKADLLIANSNLSAKYLLEWLGKKISTEVVNPAINTYALENSADLKCEIDKPFAVYSARSPKYKGGQVAIQAIMELKQEFDLVLFGAINSLPQSNSLHYIHVKSNLPDVQKFMYMRHAHMVLAPSKFEGFGMVPGEALASGTSCIVYDLPVLRQAYGNRLEYVEWGDHAAFCRKVKEVAAAPKKIVGKASREIVKAYGMKAQREKIRKVRFHTPVQDTRISAHMILYWGFLPESIESVYDHVDEILVAAGPTKLTKNTFDDGSIERLMNMPDPDNKIKIEHRKVWSDKREMRSWCTNRMTGNHHLLLDGDEIWTGLDKWIEQGFKWTAPRWVCFWHDLNHWIYDSIKMAGTRWGKRLEPYGTVCPHYRWSFWRGSFYWMRHPTVVDALGRTINKPGGIREEGSNVSAMIYHLGHCFPDALMQAKHDFYLRRDGQEDGRKNRQKVWTNWKGKLGDCGDGIICETDWELPEIVDRAYFNMNRDIKLPAGTMTSEDSPLVPQEMK